MSTFEVFSNLEEVPEGRLRTGGSFGGILSRLPVVGEGGVTREDGGVAHLWTGMVGGLEGRQGEKLSTNLYREVMGNYWGGE